MDPTLALSLRPDCRGDFLHPKHGSGMLSQSTWRMIVDSLLIRNRQRKDIQKSRYN